MKRTKHKTSRTDSEKIIHIYIYSYSSSYLVLTETKTFIISNVTVPDYTAYRKQANVPS